MQLYKKIVGDRVYLSPFDAEDTSMHHLWAKWMNDREVSSTYGGFHLNTTLSCARASLADLSGYRYSIVLNDDDLVIGHISLHDVDFLHRHAFLGVFIGESAFRGKGYGYETVMLMLSHGFNSLNLHAIALSVHADNHAGIACFKKAGFKDTGRRREWIFKNGKYEDVLYMDLLQKEYYNS